MDPSFLPGWPGPEPTKDQRSSRGNAAASWQWRQMGLNPRGCAPNLKILQEAAEDHLVNKMELKERSCEIPGVPKSTFLMVFSPDGTKVASTHGNHKIYVSELSSGKHVKTLSGHPRTPWCVAFHPSLPQLLGSGCLGGQVRVWDLNGGSEVWTVSSKAVIASIAFHPRDRLLVIATYNELYFWDWSQPQPFTKVQTINIKEKVRFVSFDTLGHKLITGISVCSFPGGPGSIHQPSGPTSEPPTTYPPGFLLNQPLDRNVPSYYSQLVHRYNNLLRNYRHLFVSQQSQLNTTDRGTDPMDIETNQNNQPPRSNANSVAVSQSASGVTSQSNNNMEQDSSDAASSLNLDVQSISLGNTTTSQQPATRSEPAPSNTMTFVTTSAPRVSSVALGRDMLRSSVRLSAFRPLFEFGGAGRPGTGPQPPTQSTTDATPPPRRVADSLAFAPNRSLDRDNIRNELTASLNRLQGYMENSIDETLNIIESHDLMRAFPVSTSSNTMSREYSAGSSRNTPPTDTFVRFPQINGAVTPNANRQQPTTSNPNNPTASRSPHNPSDMTFEQHLHNIMRDSSSTFMNLVTESAEFNTVRQILQYFHRQRNRRDTSFTERSRSPIRNIFMSSDDGSDSDREMFSPLPVHVYRSRYWNNPSARNLGNFTIDTISIEPTSTSTISRHIDHEYIRNQDVLRLSSIPAPSRPESPTYPTNMLTPSNELTSTSTISRHIDHEHIRNEVNSAERLRLGIIPPPNRPDSPTFPTNMVAPSNVPTNTSGVSRHMGNGHVRSHTNNVERSGLGNVPSPNHPESPTYTTNMQTSSLATSAGSAREESRNTSDNLLSMPSTSRHTFESVNRQRTTSAPASEASRSERDRAFNKVTRGVQAIKKHTTALINLCSNRPSLPLRQLRRMWEDLRREIISIQRQLPNQAVPSYFSLSPRARCNLLSNMTPPTESSNIGNTSATARQNVDNALQSQLASSILNPEPGPSTDPAPSNSTETRRDTNAKSHNRRTYPPSSRLQTRLRYSHRDPASRTRLRSYLFNRLNRLSHLTSSSPIRRYGRSRLPYSREHELTRVYIRCHARRVLTVMFSIMMDCLEDDNLGDQLISMLRSLKKALGLTCLLLISQTFNRESQSSNSNTSHNVEPTSQPEASSPAESEPSNSLSNETRTRIAVQISAANRNNSTNARKRRETYYLFKRSQALRNRNPSLRMQPYKREVSTAASDISPTPSTVTNAMDTSQPSTSGLQNRMRRETVPSSEASSQPSTSRTTESHPQHSNSRMYSRLFRRYLNSNYGFIRDINAFRRAENQRNSSEFDEGLYQHSHSSHQHVYQRPPPHRRIWNMGPRPLDFLHESSSRGAILDSIINNVVVPLVRVNDVPVSEMQSAEAPPPPPRQPGHVRLSDPPPMQPNVMAMEDNGGASIFGAGPNIIIETPESPVHRIQVWDFTRGELPEIGNTNVNVVVHRCKIHNDASIDISRDGRLLVALLPAQRMRNLTHRLGIYSLDWNCLGECLYTALLEQNVVSISLSPCARHLAVGLGSRRMSLQSYGRNGIMAIIYKLGELDKNDNNSKRGCLLPIRSLEQSWELGFTSLNCLRWAPQPGQGLVYANNTGQLKILS